MTVMASSPSSTTNSPKVQKNNTSSSSMFTSKEFIECAQRVQKKHATGVFSFFLLQAEVEKSGNFVENRFLYLSSESSDGLLIGVQKCVFCFQNIDKTNEDRRSFVCGSAICQMELDNNEELEADLQNLQYVAFNNRSDASRQLVY